MNLIKIFDGSFGGPTLYENPHYVPPNAVSAAVGEVTVVQWSTGALYVL